MIYPEKFPENQKNDNSREKEFYFRFRKEVPDDWDVFYSLKFLNPGLPLREIDYLVLAPIGIFIIELKNARFRFEHGKWMIYDSWERKWKEHKKIQYSGPVEQVETGIGMFCEFLRYNNHLILPVEKDSVSGGVFLNKNNQGQIPKNVHGKEYLVFQSQLEKNNLKDILIGIAGQTQVKSASHESRRDTRKIILLNGNYFPGYEFRRKAQEKTIFALTREQFKIVRKLNEEPRILIAGVAGSGKTLLTQKAIELAFENKWKTVFLCTTEILRKYILEENQNHNLLVYTKDFILKNPDKLPQFDFLIADEAQSVLSEEIVTEIAKKLQGSFMDGKWLLCYDPDQKEEVVKFFQEDLEKIPHLKLELSINIRNPSEIYQVASILGKKKFHRSKIQDALNVKFVDYSSPEDGRKGLYELIDFGVHQLKLNPEEIIILSPFLPEETDSLGSLESIRSKNEYYSHYEIVSLNESNFQEGKIGFSRISEFQGMEAPFVILTGIYDLDDPKLNTEYYIALTRATYGAGILFPEKIKSVLEELFEKSDF